MSTKRKRAGDAVVEALEAARLELEAREVAVEERENALKLAVEGVESEKRLMAGRTPRDVLRLNVGGTTCQVLRKTLCQYEKSVLAAHFSGRWDDNVDKDDQGNFFLDHPAELMLPFIDFLRAKAIETDGSGLGRVCVPKILESVEVLRLVEFYGMTQFVFQHFFEVHRGMEGSIVTRTWGPEPFVECKGWAPFYVRPSGHERTLSSYEIVVYSVTRLQFGWATQTFREAKATAGTVQNHNGLIDLDVGLGQVRLNGQSKLSVGAISVSKGTVLCCKKNRASGTFRWLIDGTQVASFTDPEPGNLYYFKYAVVSGSGSWRLGSVEYNKN